MPEPYAYPGPHPAAATGHLPPLPQTPQPYPVLPLRKSKNGLIATLVIGAAAIALIAGGIGGIIGNHLATNAPASSSPSTHLPAAPAEQVHAETVDLCTRFAAGYRAMPSPQKTGFDVLPTANFISDALRDNPAADSSIRNAVSESLTLLRQHASAASGESLRGAIQPATTWTVQAANTADQRVWDLCRAYGS